MRSVTCPDCGAQVEIPTVSVGDESVTVNCQNCLWQDLDSIYKTRRGLEIWSGGGGVAEMACWTCVPPGNGLQAAINALGNTSSTLMLQPGIYTGDITLPTNSSVHIIGSGMDSTTLTGSVTITTSNHVLEHLWVFADGKSYGIKVGNGAGSTARCELNKIRSGGNSDGTGRAPSGDGPQIGLWLNGAIDLVADHCLFAFCNTGSGLYVNSTSASWSTNVNSFRDCTFNGNARYGAEITDGGDGIASMTIHRFHGGNMEDNALGEVYSRLAIGVELKGIDFESTKTVSCTLDMGGSCILVEDCHFVTFSGSTTPRAFIMSSAGNAIVRYCRVSGGYPGADVGVFDESSVHCHAYGNQWWAPLGTNGDVSVTPRWINNRANDQGYSA